ncbi:YbaB/EbfC family nucleoid-associated protein [Nocardia sp. X0981]
MDDWESAGLRSANYGMRRQLDTVLDTLNEQQRLLGEVRAELAAARVVGRSPDGAVQVTVDASGVLQDVRFSAEALRGTPEELSRSVQEANAEAVRCAREQTRALLAPITEAAGISPDLPDLVPGAPSLREPDPEGEIGR